MRRWFHGSRYLRAAVLTIGTAVAFAAGAQEQGGTGAPAGNPPAASGDPETITRLPSPVLTLNQDRLFVESAWGKAARARAEAESGALATENRRIEEALEAEERSLTERRASLSLAEFARLAAEFDAKVEAIRTAQDAKSAEITRKLEQDRQKFFQIATPVLGQMLTETGAVAILADSAIVMSLTSLDITDAAIARMDSVLPPDAAPANPPGDVAPQSGPAAPAPAP